MIVCLIRSVLGPELYRIFKQGVEQVNMMPKIIIIQMQIILTYLITNSREETTKQTIWNSTQVR